MEGFVFRMSEVVEKWKVVDLQQRLVERYRRLTEDFKDNKEIQDHGVPEIAWVMAVVSEILK